METDLSFRDLQPLAPQGSFYEAWQTKAHFLFGGCGIPRIHTCCYGISWVDLEVGLAELPLTD